MRSIWNLTNVGVPCMGNAMVSSSCGSWHSEQWGCELLISNLFGLWLGKKPRKWMDGEKGNSCTYLNHQLRPEITYNFTWVCLLFPCLIHRDVRQQFAEEIFCNNKNIMLLWVCYGSPGKLSISGSTMSVCIMATEGFDQRRTCGCKMPAV